MDTELVSLTFNKILQSRAYTVIILGTKKKKFAIYTEPQVGQVIQSYLTDERKPRPLTHELFHNLLRGCGIRILQVVINDIEDTIYFARIFLEQEIEGKKIILEIDARPSDCITLALMNNIPVYCKKEIFEKAIAVEE